MANVVPFRNINFKASDSPATLNLRSALGDISSRVTVLSNLGPGNLSISVSYDDGATFETPFIVAAGLTIVGMLDNVDRVEIFHAGLDSGYSVFVEASVTSFSVTSIPDPKVYMSDSYFSQILLDGVAENMNVDGSITPVEYSFTVPTDRRIAISRIGLNMEDGQFFEAQDFGGISAGSVTSGVEVSITPSGGSKMVLETWTTNRQIRAVMPHFDGEFKSDGQYVGEWDIYKHMNRAPLRLNDGDKFAVLVQDDLQDLDYLAFTLYGVLINVAP